MSLTADSIIQQIEDRIHSVDVSPESVLSGEVIYVGDGVAKVIGLSGVMYNEMIEFASGATGVVLNLEENSVGVVILQ